MRVNSFTIAAVHILLAAVCFVNCAGTATVSGTIGDASPVICDEYDELACNSDYVHLETYNGDMHSITYIRDVTSRHRGQPRPRPQQQPTNNQTLSLREELQHATNQPPPPIEIVRQAGPSVEFKVHNSTFFASAASSAGFIHDAADSNGIPIETPLHIFTTFDVVFAQYP